MSDEARNRERYATDLAYAHDLSLPRARKLAELSINALDPTGDRTTTTPTTDSTISTTSTMSTCSTGGETLEAVNGAVSRCTQPGELAFAAVVPSGDGCFLPCHPVGLTPVMARTVAALSDTVSDPIALAAVAFSDALDATW